MQEFSLFIGKHITLSSLIAVVFLLLVIVETIRGKRKASALTPQAATHKINRENAVVIDIRNNDLYSKGHVIDARPFQPVTLLQNPRLLDKFRTKPLIVVCANGNEAQKTAAILLKSGYNAFSLAGGMRAWIEAQLPVVKE